MASLTGKKPSETYKDLLQISNTNAGVDGTVRKIEDGEGTVSALGISDRKTLVKPSVDGECFDIQNVAGTSIFGIDSSTKVITAKENAKFEGDGSLLTNLSLERNPTLVDENTIVITESALTLNNDYRVRKYDDYADLKTNATVNVNGDKATISCNSTFGDGGGGTFIWDSLSTAADNGGTVLQVTGITTGRWKRVIEGIVDIRWFGATGDGITSDKTKFLNAIAVAKANNYKLILEKKLYYIPGQLNINNLYLDGNGATLIGDGTQEGGSISSAQLEAWGWYDGGLTYTNLSKDAIKGNGWIECTIASTLSVGDLVKIRSTKRFTMNGEVSYQGEMHIVRKISGNTIFFNDALMDTYLVSDTARVCKTTPVTCNVRNINLRNAADDSDSKGIYLYGVKNAYIDITIDSAYNSGIEIVDCYAPVINSVNSNSPMYGLGYGVVVSGATMYSRISGVYLGCRHAIALGGGVGVPWHTEVNHVMGSALSTTGIFDVHENCGNVMFDNCIGIAVSKDEFASYTDWNSGTTYSTNDYCIGSNKTYYKAKQTTTNNDPVSDTTYTYWNPQRTNEMIGFSIRGGTSVTVRNSKIFGAYIGVNISGTITDLIVENTEFYDGGGPLLQFENNLSLELLKVHNVISRITKVVNQTDLYAALYFNGATMTIGRWIFENIKLYNQKAIYFQYNASNVPTELALDNWQIEWDTQLTSTNPITAIKIPTTINSVKFNNCVAKNGWHFVTIDYSTSELENITFDNCKISGFGGVIVYSSRDIHQMNVENSYINFGNTNMLQMATGQTFGSTKANIVNLTNTTFKNALAAQTYILVGMVNLVSFNGNVMLTNGYAINIYNTSSTLFLMSGSEDEIQSCKLNISATQELPKKLVYDYGSIIYKAIVTAGTYIGWVCTTPGALMKETWSGSNTYVRDDYVKGSDNKVYKAIVTGGQAIDPVSDTTNTYWKLASTGVAVFKQFGLLES